MRPPEITSRIQRDHLRDLLDCERTTARMPAVTLTGLLAIHDPEPLPPEPVPEPVIVRFHAPGPWHLDRLPRPAIVAVSASAALFVLSLLVRLL